MRTASPPIDRSLNMEERRWWDLWNTSYRSGDHTCAISTELFAHVALVVRQVHCGKPSRILEVACGTGMLSRQLEFSSYHGLDLSAAAVDIARQKVGTPGSEDHAPSQTYEAADFHDWPVPSTPPDVVLCVDAMHSFRDQQFVAHRIAAMLRPGGVFIVATINPVVYARIRRVGGVRLENGPVSHWLSRRELHRLIRNAGLSIERSYTIMPRGNMGLLRILNSSKLNNALGPRGAALFRHVKESVGLGQYRVLIARKG